MNDLETLLNSTSEIQAKMGYTFANPALLLLPFIHCSYYNEHREIQEHNERLEFLGDAILGTLVSDYLYHLLPNAPEGELSSLRSRLVEASSCCRYVTKLQIDQYILLGKGEKTNEMGRGRDTILADFFEALIGAVYLDGGLESARKFLLDNFLEEMKSIINNPQSNWKAVLQDYCQKKYRKAPSYEVVDETGPEHSKHFTIIVKLNENELGRGSGASKKEAQQAAAGDALSKLPPFEVKEE